MHTTRTCDTREGDDDIFQNTIYRLVPMSSPRDGNSMKSRHPHGFTIVVCDVTEIDFIKIQGNTVIEVNHPLVLRTLMSDPFLLRL